MICEHCFKLLLTADDVYFYEECTYELRVNPPSNDFPDQPSFYIRSDRGDISNAGLRCAHCFEDVDYDEFINGVGKIEFC
jgi:phage FluMu protein Com